MATETAEQPQTAAVGGVLTGEEAAARLRLPSKKAFDRRRRAAGVVGMRIGNAYYYAPEQVEAIRRHAFGLNGGKGK